MASQPGWIMDFPAWWSRSGFLRDRTAFFESGLRRMDTDSFSAL
jgi:hypothetical protein